jgi:hypothetical protein
VRFWDSSTVVSLLVEQAPSSRVAAWVAEDEAMVLWTLTPSEVVSAVRRLVRDHALDEEVAHQVPCGRLTPSNSARLSPGPRATRRGGLSTRSTQGSG